MMTAYRLPIVIFVLLTMLLFHLGLKSGPKPVRDEEVRSNNIGSEPTAWATPPYSQNEWRRLQASRTNESEHGEELALKTEGIFVLRRAADSTKPVDPLFYELLLFDLEGESVSYPATSVGVPPEPAQSIRF